MLETSTKNLGIIEAVKEVRDKGLGKTLRLICEAHLKEIRNRNAREDHVRNESLNEGLTKGEDKLNRPYGSLIADQRFDDLKKSIQDREYREQLYKHYGL